MVDEVDLQIKQWHRESMASQRLESIPESGRSQPAALIGGIGDAKTCENGRQIVA